MATTKVPVNRTIEVPVVVYTSEEVAAILKVSQRSVQRLISEGHLKASRIGRRYRILAQDVERLFTEDTPPESPTDRPDGPTINDRPAPHS